MVDPNAPTGITVDVYGEIDYTVNGHTVTVNHQAACKVGYLSGDQYVAIEAVKNADGTYNFTAPDGVDRVVLVAKGDLNEDSVVNLADKLLVARSLLLESHAAYQALTSIQMFAVDINEDGLVNLADKLLIARSLLLETHNAYQTLSW